MADERYWEESMLFGTEKLKKQLVDFVQKCGREKEVHIIYGAVLGSVSKGLQLIDSDYDTRFLYIKRGFPEETSDPAKLPEQEVIFRCALADTCFDQVPFWDTASLLQYLANPVIDGRFSLGLYHAAGSTLFSPYVWDPYGLQYKIAPLIQKCFCKEYYLGFYKEILDKEQGDDAIVNAKMYLNTLHAALTMDYVGRFQEFPPLYMPTLLQTVPENVAEAAMQVIMQRRKEARECVKQRKASDNCYYTGKEIVTERKKEIDTYINRVRETYSCFAYRQMGAEQQKKIQKQMVGIYQVIKSSLTEEPISEKW